MRLTAGAGLAAAQGKGKGAGRLCRPRVCWAEMAQGAARFGPGEEGFGPMEVYRPGFRLGRFGLGWQAELGR